MSVVTLFTRKSPTIAGLEFDAVLEDTLETTVQITDYPIESGARAADHRIIQPFRWRLIGAVSNNPIRPLLTDFSGALSELSDNNGALATLAGLSVGWLSGSDDTRAASALNTLLQIQTQGEPFDIDAGDIQLSNMVIIELRRTKDPSNEGGLIFEAQLQEMPTLSTLVTTGLQPGQFQLPSGDPAQTQAAALINKGEAALKSVGASINSLVSGVLL